MCDILALTFLMSQPILQHRRRKRIFARLFSPYHVLGPTDVNTIVSVLEAKDVASIRAGFCFAQQVSRNACVLVISTFSFISGGGEGWGGGGKRWSSKSLVTVTFLHLSHKLHTQR